MDHRVHRPRGSHSSTIVLLVGAVLTFASPALCQSADSAATPAELARRWENRGIESWFVAFEARVPGFGGMYLDDGEIVALVPNPSDESVLALIEEEFIDSARNRGQFSRQAAIRLERADYAMSALITWHELAAANTDGSLEINGIGVDHRRNRLSLRTGDADNEPGIREFAARLGIPADAIVVEIRGPALPG